MKNNGYFLTLWGLFWTNFIKNSFIYRFLCGIYSFFSKRWQTSIITSLFRKIFFDKSAAEKSFFGKLCFSPFGLLEWLQQKFGPQLTLQKENSYLIRSCKYYLHGFLALNLRFIGAFLAAAGLLSLILSVALKSSLILSLIALVLGAALSIFNVNFIDYLKSSWLVKIIEKCLGLDFSFDFYYVTKSNGLKSIVCGAVFGALTGIVWGLLSPVFAVLFAGGLWFLFMILYKVEFGVFVTLFLAPIVPTMAVVGLSLLCLFSLVVKAVTTKKFKFKTDGLGLLVIILLLLYLLSAIMSFAPFKGIQIWLVYFAFMTFYFVIINTINTKKQLFSLLTVFSLSGLCVCFYGILQYLFGWNVNQSWMDEEMFSDIKMRIYSTLENPNVLGEYILLTLPITIALMWKKREAFAKVVFAGIAAIMGIALILTFSRGCWIGIMASAAIFVTFAAGKLWGLMLLALPLIPMLLPESIINRFTSIGDMKDSSTSYRVYIWMGTLLMLKDFWLSGVGPGTEAFTQVYPFYSYSSIVAPHSHNLFLQIMVESGILGITVFATLLIAFIRRLASAHQIQGKFGELSVAIVGIGAAVIGFLVQGLFDNCFYNYRVFMIFWSVLALGTAASNISRNETNALEVKNNA